MDGVPQDSQPRSRGSSRSRDNAYLQWKRDLGITVELDLAGDDGLQHV